MYTSLGYKPVYAKDYLDPWCTTYGLDIVVARACWSTGRERRMSPTSQKAPLSSPFSSSILPHITVPHYLATFLFKAAFCNKIGRVETAHKKTTKSTVKIFHRLLFGNLLKDSSFLGSIARCCSVI
jgi:hypothetical protein